MAEGIVKTFTCPIDGNPEPNIEWYSENSGRKISRGKQFKTGESGCYSCVASNYFGTQVNITQCLIVGKSVFFMRFWPFGHKCRAFNHHHFNSFIVAKVFWVYDCPFRLNFWKILSLLWIIKMGNNAMKQQGRIGSLYKTPLSCHIL